MENQNSIKEECSKRRTFAIISHPDAGKTTLTEKLLLYSGMIQTAGMVRGRKGSKSCRLRLDGHGTGKRDFDHRFCHAIHL